MKKYPAIGQHVIKAPGKLSKGYDLNFIQAHMDYFGVHQDKLPSDTG